MTQFAHLSLHTEYSIEDSIIRIDELAEETQKRGMDSVAITDRSNMFALWKFQKRMRAQGIKPIFGVDMLVANGGTELDRLVLLAKDESGWTSLRELMTFAYTNSSDHVAITLDCLVAHNEGLIALSGGAQGPLGRPLVEGDASSAEKTAVRLSSAFGDRFYMEISRTGRSLEEAYIAKAVSFADAFHIPLVATNDVRFLDRDDFAAHETRYCIAHKQRIGDGSHAAAYSEDQFLRTAEQMGELFEDLPDAVDNACEIARRCTVEVKSDRYLPTYKSNREESPEELLDRFSIEGLEKVLERHASVEKKYASREVYEKRLERELNIIKSMDFAGYFLIVMDFVKWAKDRGIPVGPGRGSGSASLVAYVLDITEIDPIEHELMFERLLNPERVSMPDFDIDFCKDRRGEVIEYVAELYGRESVGQIVTFGTMAAKAVIRDVTRVHGKPFALGERIVKEIPDRLNVSLTDVLQERPDLSRDMQLDEDIREIVDRALKLEGIVRNISRHPGGTVITPNRLDAVVPVYTEGGSDDLISQFDKQDIEDIGVVKFDFLALKTVTAISNACEAANTIRAKNNQPPLDPSEFPLDDEMVFELLREANTIGIFQLESRGMRRVLKDLRPDSLEDLTALLALFRPGPIQSGVVDLFIRRKHGKEVVDYLHPLLESVLKKSYGVMVYQEDVMTVARELAGFSLGEADELRRAMAKKIRSEMVSFRNRFTQGCIENNVEQSIAKSIFDDIEKFAEYAFNRAHTVGYAVVAYQTAYLKAHYPAEYLAALATCDIGDRDTVREIVDEARRMELKLDGPCVNVSNYEFFGTEGRFVIGMGAIKGLPSHHAKSIEQARQEGPFESLLDLCIRAGFGRRQRKILESLIRCGCLDSLIDETDITHRRPRLEAQLDDALEAAEDRVSQASQPFDDLLGVSEDSEVLIESREYAPTSMKKALSEERERLGFCVSGHPMSTFRNELRGVCTHTDLGSLLQAKSQQVAAGMVKSCRVRDTRSGKRMLEVILEDESGAVELGVFASEALQAESSLKEGDIVVVECTVMHDKEKKDSAIRVKNLETIADFRVRRNARIEIDVANGDQTDDVLNLLREKFNDPNTDGCGVSINYKTQQYSTFLALDDKWRMPPTEELLDQLGEQFGWESVRVSFPSK